MPNRDIDIRSEPLNFEDNSMQDVADAMHGVIDKFMEELGDDPIFINAYGGNGIGVAIFKKNAGDGDFYFWMGAQT